MWAYVYDRYREEYDYFHIGGDDIYVVVENLRAYMEGGRSDFWLPGTYVIT
jgi:glycoprotein-N-acetylgalactosamine 3-beta-galactosyltransferase